jgi:hypothetical protein
MVGAPSTSLVPNQVFTPLNALTGVAYGTRSVISPFSVVRNLYVEFMQCRIQCVSLHERLPPKEALSIKSLLRLRLRVSSHSWSAPMLHQKILLNPAQRKSTHDRPSRLIRQLRFRYLQENLPSDFDFPIWRGHPCYKGRVPFPRWAFPNCT